MKIEEEVQILPDEEVAPEIVADGEDEAAKVTDEGAEPIEEDEVVVSIGEPVAPNPEEARAPEWVRELRKNHRETVRKLVDAEKRLEAMAVKPQAATLGKKPTLEDLDYDAERFESALADWFEKKRSVDDADAKAKAEENKQKEEWQAKLDSYAKSKADLKVKDYDEAEAEALGMFSVTQQGIIIQGSDNPAVLIYALGKNTDQSKKLAAITDPVKFSFAVSKLESQLKVTPRKQAPAPERQVNGTGRVSGSIDSTLERLRADAEKTGDYTKVTQYKAQKRKAQTT